MSELEEHNRGLRPVPDPELAVDGSQMELDRVNRDRQPSGDLRVGQAQRRHLENLELARRQLPLAPGSRRDLGSLLEHGFDPRASPAPCPRAFGQPCRVRH